MMVSYTNRSNDPSPEDDVGGNPSSKTKGPEMKTFSFYTVVRLGTIVAKEERSAEMDF